MDGETHDSRLGSKKKFKFTFRGMTSLCRRPWKKTISVAILFVLGRGGCTPNATLFQRR